MGDFQDNQSLTEVSGSFLWLVIVPVAILDAFFYLWTFMSLYDVVAYLEERRQTVKLNLFRRFIWVLATCLFFSTVWVCYQLYRFAEEIRWYNSDTYWHFWWISEVYWYALSCVILIAIMWLWAPNENTKQYAYYEQNINMDGDDGADGIEMEAVDNSLGDPSFTIDDNIDEDEPERFDEAPEKAEGVTDEEAGTVNVNMGANPAPDL